MPAEKLLFSFSSAEAVFFHLLPAVLLPAPMHGLLSLLCCILSFSIAIVLSALHHDLPSLVSLSSLQGGCFLAVSTASFPFSLRHVIFLRDRLPSAAALSSGRYAVSVLLSGSGWGIFSTVMRGKIVSV